ncbi:Sorting nexin-12 [Choanephora cucurbitarum]|uniref:Sorting nexin-12 n=1 Tax=Choanephora cucurbitarum TaxID=101091 RepID=A0A1C7NBH6_9FUNG|nr:Sorting nexin-12 [Choanephora cucurbitarum]
MLRTLDGAVIIAMVICWKVGWYQLFLWATSFFMLLMTLLALHTLVLYIYITYFVSPDKSERSVRFRPLRLSLPSVTEQPQPQLEPELQEAIAPLLQNIVRDFIQSWYTNISDNTDFPKAVHQLLALCLADILDRIEQTDLLHLVVNRIIPHITYHMAEFQAAEMCLRGKQLERSVTQSDELDLLLASRFRQGRLHSALTTTAVITKPTETAYLRQLVDRVLPCIMHASVLGSGPVRVVIREIVSNSVLQPSLDMLADPDFWNQTINAYLGQAIIEQKMVRQLREVLNRHSYNELDHVMEAVDPLFDEQKNKKSKKKKRMGPHSQLSTAYLGTGIHASLWQNDDDDDDELGNMQSKEDLEDLDDGEEIQEVDDMSEEEQEDQEEQEMSNQDRSWRRTDHLAKPRSLLDPFSFSPISKRSKQLQTLGFGFGMTNANRVGKRAFQSFLKVIQEEKNLLDLKRARNDIVTQIKMKRAQIGERDPEEIVDGEKVEDVMVYINRLTVAKKRVDKQIATLSGEQPATTKQFASPLFLQPKSSTKPSAPQAAGFQLKEILTHTSGLSYFMEFMDRRGVMVKLQFWLTVESLSPISQTDNSSVLNTFVQDVKRIHTMYFTDLSPHRLHLAQDLVSELLQAIQQTEHASPQAFVSQVQALRDCMTRIQQAVFQEIEKEHFPYFKRSDLYFKFLSSAPPLIGTPEEEEKQLEDKAVVPNRPASLHSFSEQKARGHQRALSDSNPSLRFLSLSSMFHQGRPQSVPASLKSVGETTEEETDEDVRPNLLVRRNTVEAVEAELRSILDSHTDPSMTRPPSSSSISSGASLWIGSHPQSMKSSTAVPVPHVQPLPNWTSSGGTNAISEIEHDSLEPLTQGSVHSTDKSSNHSHPIPEEVAPNIHLAPPGDLMLASKVQQLTEEIDKLTAQEAIVDALISKAESEQRLEELRILKKSKTMFRQERQQLLYQQLQYQLQASENVLMPDRTQVHITNATIGSDRHGEFALYVIEIQQLGVDNTFVSGWIVARRYSEFLALHNKLKEHFAHVRFMEFPGRWPFIKLQRPLVETRRVALEKYLCKLIEDREICQSQELKLFLSQHDVFTPPPPPPTSTSMEEVADPVTPSVQNLQRSMLQSTPVVDDLTKKKGIMRHIYKTVAAGIDDILVAPSMLDLITQRLGEQVMEFSQETKKGQEKALSDVMKSEGMTRFTEPLCDLFIEMFELKDKTNWLRRQAIVIIIQQILEGTIERKLRDTVKYLASSSMIVFYVHKLTDSLWPNGGPLTFKEPRKPEEKLLTKEEANRKLSTWLPDVLGNMVGRQNARKGARRLFTVLQNKRLNQDLVYTLLDEIIYALFPELKP